MHGRVADLPPAGLVPLGDRVRRIWEQIDAETAALVRRTRVRLERQFDPTTQIVT